MEVQVAELQWVPAGQLGSAWCLGRELAKPEDQPPLPLSSWDAFTLTPGTLFVFFPEESESVKQVIRVNDKQVLDYKLAKRALHTIDNLSFGCVHQSHHPQHQHQYNHHNDDKNTITTSMGTITITIININFISITLS